MPQPPGANLIRAKQLFDQLDPSAMTPEEQQQHAALKQQLESQPAVAAWMRGARPGQVTPTSPDSFKAPQGPSAGGLLWEGLKGLGSVIPRPSMPSGRSAALQQAGVPRSVAGPLSWLPGSDLIAGQLGQVKRAQTAKPGYEKAVETAGAAVPVLGPMVAPAVTSVSRPTEAYLSGRAPTQQENKEAARAGGELTGMVVAPKVVPKVLSGVARGGGSAYTRLTARLPERMIGSIAGSESRAGARAVMARRIPTAGDPGNLPVENFAKNVAEATDQAGADVSRVIDTHTAATKGAAVDVADALQKPYEKRIAEVSKFARGEQSADTQVAALTDQVEARQRAAADYAGIKDWQPGDPIPMTPSQIHKFTKDWRFSTKGGFDRMEPTEQAAIMNLHDIIKSQIPDAAPAMQDYHDLLRYNENLQTYAAPEGGAVQGEPLVPPLISSFPGMIRRKIAGGAAWKVPMAYMLNDRAPAGYRYTGTFNPAQLPAASAENLAGGATATPAAPAPPTPVEAPAPRAPRQKFSGTSKAAKDALRIDPFSISRLPPSAPRLGPLEPRYPKALPPAPEASSAADGGQAAQPATPKRFDPQAIIERNRRANLAATAEAGKLAEGREAEMPVRRSAGVQQTLRPRKPGESLSATSTASAGSTAEEPKAASQAAPPAAPAAAAPKAPMTERLQAKKPVAQASTAPASASRLPSQMTTAELKDLLPQLRQQASGAKGDAAKKLNMRADIVAGELKRRLTAEGKPTANPLESLGSKPQAAAPAKPATAPLQPGDQVETKAGTGTVTHTVKKADGSTVHFVSGVGTESGRTVVHKQPEAEA